MIKTIKLREGLELTMTNDSLWMEEYRDQFGQDILPVIMPLILSLSSSISALAEEAGDLNKIDQDAVVRVLGSESMLDIGIRLAQLELTDVHRIMWAMTKAYDENIPDLRAWLRELAGPEHESLPIVDVCIPAIAELAVKGVITEKNWERLTADLKKIKKSLQPQKKKQTKKK